MNSVKCVLIPLWLSSLVGCSLLSHTAAPHITGVLVTPDVARRIKTEISSRVGRINSWKSLSFTTIERRGEGKKVNMRQAIIFHRPYRLRLDTLAPGSAYTLNLIAADESRVVYVDTQEKLAVLSSSAADLLEKVIGVSLEVHELADYLSGELPPAASAENVSVYDDRKAGLYILVAEEKGYYIGVDQRNLHPKWVKKRDPYRHDLEFEISYLDYREIEGVILPVGLEIQVPRDSLNIRLIFSRVSINVPVREELFRVPIPPGYKVRRR